MEKNDNFINDIKWLSHVQKEKYGFQSTTLTISHLDLKSWSYASDSYSFYMSIKDLLGQTLCKRIY